MRHVTSPVLRRLHDEPLAVPDTARRHVAACGRCQATSSKIAADATTAARFLGPGTAPAGPGPAGPGTAPAGPASLPADTDLAWERIQARLRPRAPDAPDAPDAPHAPATPRLRKTPARDPWARRPVLAGASFGTGTVVAAGVLVAGVGAAAALSTVYAPTTVAPVQVSQQDLHAIAAVADLSSDQLGPGLPPDGTRQLPFGTLTWTTAGRAHQATSIAAASAATGLAFTPPRQLPAGVGSLVSVTVQPQVTATIKFSAPAGQGVAGSTLVVTGGPGLLVQYGSAGGQARPVTLAVAAMQRPTAASSGATAAALEAFLLRQPRVPAGLAAQLRLLGTASLPVPVPAGLPATRVTVDGSPGVLVIGPSGVASGLIWEGRDSIVRGVAGLLDKEDILNVADQIG